MLTWTAQSLGQLIELFVIAAALYLAPGYAVLRWLWPTSLRPLSSAERFGLAIGVSLSLPPLLLYGSHLAGLTWSRFATWTYVVVAMTALIVPALYRAARRPMTTQWRSALSSAMTWDGCLIVALTLIAAIVRLYSVRDLRAGMFGDSYHHTMIVQLLADNGGLFHSWQPYAPLASFTYHFGFHANVAFYGWLTGTPATLSVLIVGQLMNAAAVPLAHLLTARIIGAGAPALTRSTLPVAAMAGVWAATFTGFVNLMPAYYVNWGRYTQLAGQLLLPAVVVCWIELFDRVLETSGPALRRQARLIALAALMTASLMLTHYIVTLFAVLMVGAALLASVLYDANWRSTVRLLIPSTIGAAVALLIAAPWIRNTLGAGLVRNTSGMVSGEVAGDRVAAYASLLPITPSYLKGWMIALAGLGLFIAIAQRQWRATLFAVWSGLLLFTVTPHTVGLPGTGLVDQLTAYIALYLTVLPLAGFALAAMQDWLASRLSRINTALAQPALHMGIVSVITLAIALWGATWLPGVVEPSRQLLTPADERALAWIQEHTPNDARFLVNTFPAYGGSLIAGTDGGWWIPLLTSRRTNLPPITYGSERFERSDFYATTNGLSAALRGGPLTDPTPMRIDLTQPENLQRLHDAGITHVYKGANAVPDRGSADWIDTSVLRNDTHFRLIYDRDGVEIFELVKR